VAANVGRAALFLLIFAELLALPFAAQVAASPSLTEAAKALAAGNLADADERLQAILNTDPKNYRAFDLLGVVRAEQHRNSEAEKIFLSVIEHDPRMASAHVNLGLLYAQTARDAESVTQLEEALQIEPSRPDAVMALAGVLRRQARAAATNDPEEALSYLLKARKVAPGDPDVLYDFGMVALRMNLNTDAAEAFRGVLAERKDEAAALYGLGRAQLGLKQYENAQVTFQQYLSLKPNDASGHYALGLALAALQQPDAARREFGSSITLQPAQTESYFQLGLVELEQRQLDSAAEDFRRVLDRDAHHAGALTGMGRLQFERKNYPRATDYLRQAIAAYSDQRQAHYYLGLTLARIGRKEESEKELGIAAQIEHAELQKQQASTRIENAK
jgi:tetratricopeptide (TPR) repeat protein